MTRPLRPFVVFAFATTHDALEAEDALKAGGFDVVPVPTPKITGSRCGIAMRVPPEQADAAGRCLLENDVNPVARVGVEDV